MARPAPTGPNHILSPAIPRPFPTLLSAPASSPAQTPEEESLLDSDQKEALVSYVLLTHASAHSVLSVWPNVQSDQIKICPIFVWAIWFHISQLYLRRSGLPFILSNQVRRRNLPTYHLKTALAATQTLMILTKTGPESVPIARLHLSRPLEPI